MTEVAKARKTETREVGSSEGVHLHRIECVPASKMLGRPLLRRRTGRPSATLLEVAGASTSDASPALETAPLADSTAANDDGAGAAGEQSSAAHEENEEETAPLQEPPTASPRPDHSATSSRQERTEAADRAQPVCSCWPVGVECRRTVPERFGQLAHDVGVRDRAGGRAAWQVGVLQPLC